MLNFNEYVSFVIWIFYARLCDFGNLTMNLCNLDRLCVIKFN